jgi:hypothetical protein
LNPLDARSPYWNPAEELAHDAEARTMAESVFPDQPKETPFFIQTPRKIFAEMLRRGMDAAAMVATMTDGAALDKLVEGTEMASMISHAAPSQREGVRASLNLVADALRLLKKRRSANGMECPRMVEAPARLDLFDEHAGTASAAATRGFAR